MTFFRFALAAGLAASLATSALAQPTGASAPEVSAEDKARALKLFNDGRATMQEPGKLDRACELLSQSYGIHKRGDTLLNLAECHRRQGKTATAWREFDEAIRYAEAVEFPEAIDAAKGLRDELATHLSMVIVDVPKGDAAPKDLAIVLDGKPLPSAQWNQDLFVDPGKHTVTASAEGYEPFATSTDIASGAGRTSIEVALKKIPPPPEPQKPAPPPPPPPKPKPAPPPEKGSVPVWSVVVGSIGVAALGVSIGFGVDTVNVGGELDDECGPDRKACPKTYDFHSARSEELRSYGLFVGFGAAGLAATGAGVVGLVLGLTHKAPPPVAIAPWATPEGAGLAIAGKLP
jgi:hypothetical protein